MRKKTMILSVLVLAMAMLVMVSCGKSELVGDIVDDKTMNITANNAGDGDYFMTGTLEVEGKEQVTITPDLKNGSLKIEFIAADDNEDIEEVPNTDVEAVYTAYVSGTETQTVGFGEGEYMV